MLKHAATIVALCAANVAILSAQTFTNLLSFDGTNGQGGLPLVLGLNGDFYGTAGGAPAIGLINVFQITPMGAFQVLDSFSASSPTFPPEYYLLATNGDFYGGGHANPNNLSTVVEMTPSGKFTTIYTFPQGVFVSPNGGLTEFQGNFYGTTNFGGVNSLGTVFKLTPSGQLTTLYSFCSQPNCADGYAPNGALALGSDGNFYGTTSLGGVRLGGPGTIFEITPSGQSTTLYTFCGSHPNCVDGGVPNAGLVAGGHHNFYGTTSHGGSDNSGVVFEITESGKYIRLYSFCALCPQGRNPTAPLVLGSDGNLYGTTPYGGAYAKGTSGGTIFQITPAGALSVLYSFCGQPACTDGNNPFSALVQGTDGSFYGTTELGGTFNYGTIFKLATGLAPFVKMLPNSGEPGRHVTILGTNLAGSTSVTFNGTQAAFDIVSATEIRTTVPTGAATGTVNVVTPTGTLSSNLPFRVR